MDKLFWVGLALLLTPGWEDLPFLPGPEPEPGLGVTHGPCHPVTMLALLVALVPMDPL